MSIKHIITLLFLAAMTIPVNAAKSTGAAHTFPQPDGTQITVQLLGDENMSWYQTIDEVLLTRIDNGYYIARTDSDGVLYSTGILAHNQQERTEQETMAIAAQDKSLYFNSVNEALFAKRRVIAGYPNTKGNFCPHNDTIRVPVIMMEYTDVKFTFADHETWNEYFNGTSITELASDTRFKGYSSVAQYFKDASNGKLTFVFDIYGPYTAKYNHDYYGHNKGDYYEKLLLKEAVTAANDTIDFNKYDSNNDYTVDMVYILYAGTGANTSGDNNDFWPACWYGLTGYTNLDGNKKIKVMGAANELVCSASTTGGDAIRAGVGVTCHEMSHGMGLPDLYWTTSSYPKDAQGYTDPNNCGPEDWDLMDGGENLYNGIWPCQFTAWEREIMGWLDVDTLSEAQTVTLYPLNEEGGKACCVVNPSNKNEYYIIENYQHTGWNKYISNRYGTGLMITHVNTTSTGLSMSPNNTYGKPNVTILPADGFILASYSAGLKIQYKGEVVTMPSNTSTEFNTNYYVPDLKGDPYPGSQNITSLAAYKNYTGEDMVNQYPITDITKNSDGSITFKFMGGATADLNNDSVVDINDVCAAIQYMLAPDTTDINLHAADLDGDGKITPNDIEAIKDIILQKQ